MGVCHGALLARGAGTPLSAPRNHLEMKMSEHTPGPWEVLMDADYDEWRDLHIEFPIGVNSPEFQICVFEDEGINLHNARLIAAAPDLLEACKLALAAIYFYDNDEMHDAADQINAAIIKATGA